MRFSMYQCDIFHIFNPQDIKKVQIRSIFWMEKYEVAFGNEQMGVPLIHITGSDALLFESFQINNTLKYCDVLR